MSFDVYLPFAAAVIFATAGVRLARRLRPAQATWLLSCGSLVISVCGMCSLILLTWALVARIDFIASFAEMSGPVLRRLDPVSVAVSVPAVTILAIVCVRAGRAAAKHSRSLARAHRACRALPAALGELVVIPAADVATFALPGRPGRIIVSQQTLGRLTVVQRNAMFAHERSHLRHRHHVHRIVAALAAAANPLLWPVPRALSHAVERWADEDAARYTGGPDAVVSALCRVAHEESHKPGRATGWRIAALHRPASRRSWVLTMLAAASLIGLLANSAEAAGDADQLWHHARVSSSAPLAGYEHPLSQRYW